MGIQINKIKTVLSDHGRTNKWLAEKIGKSPTTVSRWCTNESQPPLETLYQISILLNTDIRELGQCRHRQQNQEGRHKVSILIFYYYICRMKYQF